MILKIIYKSVFFFILVIVMYFLSCNTTPGYIPDGYKLVYSQTFDTEEAIYEFEFTEAGKWLINQEGNGSMALEFTGNSEYQPEVSSPHIIGLISEFRFSSFVLEADLLQTGEEYGHRDMCLFFGFQDPAHFYYVHMATQTDEHAHNIFIVNNEPRTKISTKTTDGIDWGDNIWHKIRLVRNIEDGTVKLFFDDMDQPVMEARDKNFGEGYIGFGSFDDSGKIDNIKIWASKVESKASGFFDKK